MSSGICCECCYYTKRGTSGFDSLRNSLFGLNGCNDVGFCTATVDAYGNFRKVKGLDGCHCGCFAKKAEWK